MKFLNFQRNISSTPGHKKDKSLSTAIKSPKISLEGEYEDNPRLYRMLEYKYSPKSAWLGYLALSSGLASSPSKPDNQKGGEEHQGAQYGYLLG